MAEEACRIAIPAPLLEQLRVLHLKKSTLDDVLRLLQYQAQEFDREVLAFARAHGVPADRIENVDLDGGALALAPAPSGKEKTS